MIPSRVTPAGGRAWSTAVRSHIFIRCQASRWSGESNPNSFSTSFPASSVRRLLSPFKLATIAWPNHRMCNWSLAGYRRAETLLSTSLHAASKIYAFFRASRALGFGTALCRAVKSPSSLVGVVGGRRGSRLRLPRYSECFLRGALRRQPSTK